MSKQTVRIWTKAERTMVNHNGDVAYASLAKRMDGSVGLVMDGTVAFYGASLSAHEDELRAATIEAIGQDGYDKTYTYGEQVDNTAELDACEAGHKAIEDAMTLGGRSE